VVIGDFDFVGALRAPFEAQAILIVGPNRMLSGRVANERMEFVAGRAFQIHEVFSGI